MELVNSSMDEGYVSLAPQDTHKTRHRELCGDISINSMHERAHIIPTMSCCVLDNNPDFTLTLTLTLPLTLTLALSLPTMLPAAPSLGAPATTIFLKL